jgi:hypothetical protein
MTKLVALCLFLAVAVMAVRYTNEVVDQYNALSPTAKIVTYVYCQSDAGSKNIQDTIDCAILNTL